MKNIFIFSFFLLSVFAVQNGYSQDNSIEFIENKGQWDQHIKFKGEMNGGAFFITNTGFTVVKHHQDDWKTLTETFHSTGKKSSPAGTAKPVIVRSHAYNVDFLNASPALVAGEEIQGSYNNYFIGDDPVKWATRCRVYKAVIVKNVYKNVDIKYFSKQGSLKYDIIVNPGANVNEIALKHVGTEGLQLKNRELVIKTSVGAIKELSPYTYQLQNGLQKQVDCRFDVNENVVRFKVNRFSNKSALIIDPTIVFSSFTGSTADNWGYTATYGPDGSFFAGGIVFGSGYPTSTGAYQTTLHGGFSDNEVPAHDIGIMKFNSSGTKREYATYLGGSGNEQPHSLVTDNVGNLVIAGRSSSPNYPVTSGRFGTGGGNDIVITKLNSSGTGIIGSIKIGGGNEDGINIAPKYSNIRGAVSIRRNYGDDARSEVLLDNENNIYLASCTQSLDFPTTPGAAQSRSGHTNSGNRTQDGVVIKTNPNLSAILFSTFLGGGNDDAAFSLALHPKTKNIYVAGSTASTNFPGTTNGTVINGNFQGGICDGYVSILSNDGSTLIKSTYIGTSGNDMLYYIQMDQSGIPYIIGTGSVSFPAINAPFTQTEGKQFVSKLQPDLSGYIYSTNFGALTNNAYPNLSPTAFFVDACERVYVAGWGGSINFDGNYPNSGTNGLTVTPAAFKATTDGSDFYFLVLEPNAAALAYASFFGQVGGIGEHVDGGTSRFNKDGTLYQAICANCGRDVAFPTTPGAWATTNGSRECNQAALKISFNLCDKAYATNYWVGSSDTSWHNPLNWSTGIVPNVNVDVVINRGTPHNCVITSPAECRTLTTMPGGSLTANDNLTVKE